MTTADPRRALPAIGRLIEHEALQRVLADSPRTLVLDVLRTLMETARANPDVAPRSEAEWAEAAKARLADVKQSSLRRVLNGTGVILHTNLGRAPLASAALEALQDVSSGYATLEYDLASGKRGSRMTHCRELLRELTGAEDALVVTNCAASLVLALTAFASGRDAIVSRGELIEIGGSFRVPDIMGTSGARLVEVGTTNRTHLADYARAITPTTGAIVKVHRSNFSVEGFVAETGTRELAGLAREHDIALLHDFGSGLMVSLEQFGLRGEPTVREIVAESPTLVMMSGDKLMGGPQAGIMLGTADAIARVSKHPLARALRVDKMTIAALHATLSLYRDAAVAVRAIPILAMLTTGVELLRSRAERLREQLAKHGVSVHLRETEATVGGGAFPVSRIPSVALGFANATRLEPAMRRGTLPVIGRIANDEVLVDLRSIPPADDDALLAALVRATA